MKRGKRQLEPQQTTLTPNSIGQKEEAKMPRGIKTTPTGLRNVTVVMQEATIESAKALASVIGGDYKEIIASAAATAVAAQHEQLVALARAQFIRPNGHVSPADGADLVEEGVHA